MAITFKTRCKGTTFSRHMQIYLQISQFYLKISHIIISFSHTPLSYEAKGAPKSPSYQVIMPQASQCVAPSSAHNSSSVFGSDCKSRFFASQAVTDY